MSANTAVTNGTPELLTPSPAPAAKSTDAEVKTKKCPRKVFGRLSVVVDDKKFWFEMRKNGFHIREFRTRKAKHFTFQEVMDLLRDQLIFKF